MNSDYAKFISEIAENLGAHCKEELSIYDFEGEPGPHRVAYAVVEISDSAEKLVSLAARLRKFSKSAGEDLSEFRDEIEHLLYHVKDSGAFSDLIQEGEDE